jgi:hypothetical protein
MIVGGWSQGCLARPFIVLLSSGKITETSTFYLTIGSCKRLLTGCLVSGILKTWDRGLKESLKTLAALGISRG